MSETVPTLKLLERLGRSLVEGGCPLDEVTDKRLADRPSARKGDGILLEGGDYKEFNKKIIHNISVYSNLIVV